MIPLSPKTTALVDLLFSLEECSTVKRLLEDECGQNLPFCKDSTPESLERIRFAALNIGTGDADHFFEAVSLAQLDWRDLLMWAKFSNSLTAHEEWAEEILGSDSK
jgi:hypothetical protein